MVLGLENVKTTKLKLTWIFALLTVIFCFIATICSAVAMGAGGTLANGNDCEKKKHDQTDHLETCTITSTSYFNDSKFDYERMGKTVQAMAGPGMAAGIIGLLVGLFGIVAVGKKNKTMVTAFTVIMSLIVVALIALAAWSGLIGGAFTNVCKAQEYKSGEKTASDDCSELWELQGTAYNVLCPGYPILKKEEVHCEGTVDGASSSCSCACLDTMREMCEGVAGGLSGAGALLGLAGAMAFLAAIMGCMHCSCCGQNELDEDAGPTITTTAEPVAQAVAVETKS